MKATQYDNNMVATQNKVHTFLGTDNSTKGTKVETTIHHTKQPQLSVSVSMIETLNEEIEIKLSSLSVFLQLVPVASCSELKRRATQRCVCFGDL
jgi:hypothetical protein